MLAALLAATLLAAPPPTPRPASGADIVAAVRDAGAAAVVVNVWATWCVPCREEMPDLLRLRRDYAGRGVQVWLVSADFAADAGAAAAFLAEQGVDFPTYLKRDGDMPFIDAFDPDWSGALPATFIYDGSGRRRQALFGKSTYAQLEAKVLEVLKGAP